MEQNLLYYWKTYNFVFEIIKNSEQMKTTKKEENKKQEVRDFFNKMMEDKRAINDCIRNGGNLKQLTKTRGIKFATPI